MKLDDKKVTEIFLGLILIIILIILIFLFIQPKSTNSQTIQTTPQNIMILNSYNTNSYNQISPQNSPTKTYTKTNLENKIEKNKSYTIQSKKEITKGVLGNEIARYIIYIKNIGDKSKYFKVKFKFNDCYKEKTSTSITKYIQQDDEEKFIYIDIKNKYCDWDYEIIKQ